MYLAKFDENGKRTKTLLACEYTDEQKQEMYADGFVDLSEEDWNYYVGNMGMGVNGTGYIRDSETGKPVDAPPSAPPTKEQRIAELDSDYKSNVSDLQNYMALAMLRNDTDLIAELQDEFLELQIAYNEAIEELN